MIEEDTEEIADLDFVEIWQLPDGKWEVVALGVTTDEPCDTFNQAVLFALTSLAGAFVMHINEDAEYAHSM